MTRQTARLAFDIETISPDVPARQRPDFEDSSQFELFAGTIAHQEQPGSDIEALVYFRDGRGPTAELDLIDQLLGRLTDYETSTVLTYNGEAFDFRHLAGRARRAAADLGAREAIPEQVELVLETIESDDLIHDAWDAFGEYTTLEEACQRAGVEISNTYWVAYDHGLDPADWRAAANQGRSEVLSADVAQLGEHYLNCVEANETETACFRELEAMVTEYALADVEPLFALADQRPFE
jgi:hypothetical protein